MGDHSCVVLVLNYDGRHLLEECLPSITEAAAKATVPCRVVVIDNDSTDDSRQWLAETWPGIECLHEPNRGLASFNHVLSHCPEPFAILLNNDVKLAPDSIDPLVQELARQPNALFAAPFCLGFDDTTYEGMRTRVRDRFGLIQGVCRVPGHEAHMHRADLTASAGPILAVDRAKFLALGGYDPIYFPGRLEDLDLSFRGWMHGWRGLYVPASRAWHKGFGSFEPAFGMAGCDRLALRNTLIFTWRNIRGRRLLRHWLWIGPRLMHSVMFRRGEFARAFAEAVKLWSNRSALSTSGSRVRLPSCDRRRRQEAFFRRFSW